jgi:hypothetical protein
MHSHFLIVYAIMIRQLIHLPLFPWHGVTIRQQTGRLALTIALGFTTLFFTNATIVYYRDFYQIRETGQSMAVIVQRTERTLVGKGTQKSRAKTFRYQAVFQFQNQERTMPVSKNLYNSLKPGDPVQVLYGARQDTFIPTNDPADHRQLITPLIFWAVLVVTLLVPIPGGF